MPVKIGGKANIVPGKGQHYNSCVIDFNMDIESNTCAVTLDKKGNAHQDRACDYCYAKYLYKKDPKSYRTKIIREHEFKKIAAKYGVATNGKGLILRLGKNVECGHKNTRPQLYQVLEYCIKYNFRPIITSKLLEFDPKIAELITTSRGIVHISLGRDEDELGAVLQGATNEWRLQQAIMYKQVNCPTQVRIVADITLPMGAFHKKAFNSMGGSTGVLLTPLHYTNRTHFESMRKDITWDEAKEKGIFSYSHGDMRPNIIHEDWQQTRERCGTIAGKEYCNNCVRKIEFNKKEYKAKLIELKWNS